MQSLEKIRDIAENSGDPYELGRYLHKMCNEVEQLQEKLRDLTEGPACHCPHCHGSSPAEAPRHHC